MLIKVNNTPKVESFKELYEYTLDVLRSIEHDKKTVVLGPITAQDSETVKENLDWLSFYSQQLSERGWVVLELSSFQPVVEDLMKKLNIEGYPYGILHDFTLPLLRSKCFNAVHFRENYSESLGATLEHDATLGADIPIRYLP